MLKILTAILMSQIVTSFCYSATNADVYRIWNKLPHKKNSQIIIINNPNINASAHPLTGLIVINSGLVKFVTKDELARVIGHEIAHTIHGLNEDKADYYGSVYAKEAGYNMCNARKYFIKLKKLTPGLDGSGQGHSSYSVRYNIVSKVGGCK